MGLRDYETSFDVAEQHAPREVNTLQNTHPSIVQVPVVVTDCAPHPIILDLHPALVWCAPIYQTNRVLGYSSIWKCVHVCVYMRMSVSVLEIFIMLADCEINSRALLTNSTLKC